MLSIIIPYYKISFFDYTLQSLANQTNKNFNVIIGDDNSKDSPSKLLEKYNNIFNFQYTKFDVNFGSNNLVKQWIRCINLDNSNNEWLMILGDDDVLSKNVVEEFYKHKKSFDDKFNVVRFSTVKIDEKNEFISPQYLNPETESVVDFLFKNSRSSLSEYIFKKDNLVKVGIKSFPLAWHSDVLAVMEVANFEKIYSINEGVIHIRISQESISGSSNNMPQKLQATFQFYYYLLSSKKNFFTKDQKQILLQKLINSYFHKKKNALNFLKLSFLHFRYFSSKEYLLFLKTLSRKIVMK